MKSSELFDKVLEKPAMYVGRPSIALIHAFINGYEFERQASGFKETDKLYWGFTGWVAKKYRIQTAHSWSDMIAFMNQSETGAFETTKELWEEYKSVRDTKRRRTDR